MCSRSAARARRRCQLRGHSRCHAETRSIERCCLVARRAALRGSGSGNGGARRVRAFREVALERRQRLADARGRDPRARESRHARDRLHRGALPEVATTRCVVVVVRARLFREVAAGTRKLRGHERGSATAGPVRGRLKSAGLRCQRANTDPTTTGPTPPGRADRFRRRRRPLEYDSDGDMLGDMPFP
jgi:hypothetical protein